VKEVFVTGATGFLGTNLIMQLVDRGVHVHATYREKSDRSAFADLPVQWHLADVTDAASLHAACPEKVDVFFHAAGDTSMWKLKNAGQRRTNVTGTENAIRTALEKHAGRFVHTSSIAVYGIHAQVITESSPRLGGSSSNNYYRTKFEAEELVRAARRNKKLPAVILNPCHLVGEWDRHNWSRMIGMVRHGKLPGVPPGRGSFCDIAEVAKAHITAAQRAAVGENYILAGTPLSFVEFVTLIGNVVGRETPQKPVPALVLKSMARVSDWISMITRKEPSLTPENVLMVCDNLRVSGAKAERDLDYNADVNVKAVLERCYHWMQKEGLLDPES